MPLKLSVITITYNDTAGLQKTLSSLAPLLNSGIEWEHVVVDSSPDLNANLLSQYNAPWPLVRLSSSPQGVYAAFNLGLDHCRGEIVWFLNGGDEMRSFEVLTSVLERFDQAPAVDLVCACAELWRDGKYLYPHPAPASLEAGLLGSNRICHQAVLYRSKVFEKVGNFSTEYRIAGDYEHHWKCVIAGSVYERSDLRLVRYDTGGTSSNYRLAFQEFKKINQVLRAKLGVSRTILNEAFWLKNRLRTGLLKSLSQSQAALFLRPLWLSWNRLKK